MGTLKIFLLLAAVLVQVACSVPREDKLECGLSDGSKFVLKSEYNWYPIHFGHSTERIDRHRGSIVYVPLNGPSMDLDDSYGGGITGNHEAYALQFLCASFGGRKGIAFVGSWNSQSSLNAELPKKLSPDVQGKKYKELFLDHKTFARSFFVERLNGVVFYEMAVLSLADVSYTKIPLQAVYQSISKDNGKTWSDPVITKDAKIFEIGKSIQEQCFIARPISINGKKIEAHFPQCPQERR